MSETAAPATPAPATPGAPDADLLFTGDVFCDLVFTGVDAPEIGAEVFADSFGISPGGAANRAVAGARAGAHTLLASWLGDDPIGTHVRTLLEGEPRLDLRLFETIPGAQSPISVALSGPHDRSFVTYQDRSAGEPTGLGAIGAAHVGLARELPAWVGSLRAAGTTIVGGIGWDDSGLWSSDVLDRLGGIDVFVPNEVEALRYTRTDDALAAAKALAERVPLAVVTRGPLGAIAVDSAAGIVVEVGAPRVDAVDPTGAGDVFVAQFMATGLRGADLETRLRIATLAASIAVTGVGGAASAPRASDLRTFASAHHLPGDWTFLSDPPTAG